MYGFNILRNRLDKISNSWLVKLITWFDISIVGMHSFIIGLDKYINNLSAIIIGMDSFEINWIG